MRVRHIVVGAGAALSIAGFMAAATMIPAWRRAKLHVVCSRLRELSAAVASASFQAGEGCPTLDTVLKTAGHADPSVGSDPWGSRLRVTCSPDGVLLSSAGPDGRFGTADDIRASASGDTTDECERGAR